MRNWPTTGPSSRRGSTSCGGSDCWATNPASTRRCCALYRYLGRTPSRLLGLSLADAVGEMRTQNQPGTTDEYPNWRVPLGGPDGRRLLLEDVFHRPACGRARRGHAGRGEPAGVTLSGLSPVSHLSRLRYVRTAPT